MSTFLSSYLNKPGKEENQSDEIEVGTPARETVNCSVHEEHPAFLRRSLIDCEYTRACQDRTADGITTGFWNEKTCLRQSIVIHTHCLHNSSSSIRDLNYVWHFAVLKIWVKLCLTSRQGNFSITNNRTAFYYVFRCLRNLAQWKWNKHWNHVE